MNISRLNAGFASPHLAPRAQSVPDARRLFLNWGENVIQAGVMTLLHRVVFYGHHAEAIRDLGDPMGFKVVEEGGVA